MDETVEYGNLGPVFAGVIDAHYTLIDGLDIPSKIGTHVFDIHLREVLVH